MSKQLKHEMAKAFVHAMLKQSRYRVIPSGMEDVIREVTPLTKSEYEDLDLPGVIRNLPDFIVLDRSATKRYMVDVNYRSEITKSFKDRLSRKLEILDELVLIVFNGRSKDPGKSGDLSEVVRCCRLERSSAGIMAELYDQSTIVGTSDLSFIKPQHLWGRMLPLRSVFDGVATVEPRFEAAVETASRAFAA